MILVDTSVWIDHLRSGDAILSRLLGNSGVLGHPWVTGEVALGNLRQRDEVVGLLGGLPQAVVADNSEILGLIKKETLYGAGIGYVDAQLLAAIRLTPEARLWTRDRCLLAIAARLALDFSHPPLQLPRPVSQILRAERFLASCWRSCLRRAWPVAARHPAAAGRRAGD